MTFLADTDVVVYYTLDNPLGHDTDIKHFERLKGQTINLQSLVQLGFLLSGDGTISKTINLK